MKAACVTTIFVGILYCSFDPLPAGENTVGPRYDIPLDCLLQQMPDSDLAATDDSVAQSAGGVTADETAEATATTTATADAGSGKQPVQDVDVKTLAARGEPLTNDQLIQLYVVLLKDGARFMDTLDTYSVIFHKEERIGGDLLAPQQVDMKVQHAPNFAVYMRWLNGDKGRQVLYSDAYEDGCLSVKFGGIKRFLPALRVQPDCANAKAESRHPVTQAGIRNLITKLVRHREADLQRGGKVTCVRTPNLEFDGRECSLFELTYAVPVAGCPYRKHTLLIDSQLHIPLRVKNFTWADENAGQMPESELDQTTLIEHYAFTQLNLTRKLTAIDFSRDNPRYRM